ncbi:MAG TPA: 16S rRNA (guanine(527)-N(7))-methyltransferase RsmG [Bacteroidales bacterium]|nr:16S rRNA (guanine(527)-N(7))-methyltransferase RsmG [Bacteroidales bacterium]HPS27779.1 16S rRNA (guanine(527)-N(7))-methyltransferase RsmG [Bacteroidales bacterium]
MELLKKYFPGLSEQQIQRFEQLGPLYSEWNEKINVISRQDIDNLYLHHILHSLSIARLIQFAEGTTVMDVGTGGGFPGIPLAIMFPEADFYLIDSTGKKITVVSEIVKSLGLENVIAEQKRVEEVDVTFDFIVSRAVTSLPDFIKLVKKNISTENFNTLTNGILYLKGDDAANEIKKLKAGKFIFDIYHYFPEEYFETKKIVYLYNL